MASLDTFGCGHARTKENTQWAGDRALCRICHRKAEAASRQRRREKEKPVERYVRHRLAYLPTQLENARRKLAALENEARRYGMHDLLENVK